MVHSAVDGHARFDAATKPVQEVGGNLQLGKAIDVGKAKVTMLL